jgi:hypothetical protein
VSKRLPLYVLLVSAPTFLASLFLPWRETKPAGLGGVGAVGVLTLFEGETVGGWVEVAGDVAVLLVVAIALATIATLRRPQLGARLPLGGLGVALGYFAVAIAVGLDRLTGEVGGFTSRPAAPHTSWTYGFYLGLASAGIAALAGLALRRGELLRPRGTAEAAAVVLGIALLIAFLLPWAGFRGSSINLHGIETAAAAIAALGLLLGAGWLHGEAGRRWRLPLAIATAILTGGAAGALGVIGLHQLYGTWVGIGCAVSLVALEAVHAWPVRVPALPPGLAAVRTGAAALLIVALFLPWQEVDGHGISGPSYDGWYSVTGAAAGSLCLLLLAGPALPAVESYVLDAVAAVVIFVSLTGTQFRESPSFYRIGYGALLGFAAAGILLVTAVLRLRPAPVERGRALARVVPLAASVLCIAAVVVPEWFVLPERWTFQASALYGSLEVPGVLIALYLIRLWARNVRGPARTDHRLTLVPLILLTLAALELIRFRNGPVIWGAVILVGLCLLLAVLGWVEESSGLEGMRVPETLRVDRLPETES